jgi:hypothetical protein
MEVYVAKKPDCSSTLKRISNNFEKAKHEYEYSMRIWREKMWKLQDKRNEAIITRSCDFTFLGTGTFKLYYSEKNLILQITVYDSDLKDDDRYSWYDTISIINTDGEVLFRGTTKERITYPIENRKLDIFFNSSVEDIGCRLL